MSSSYAVPSNPYPHIHTHPSEDPTSPSSPSHSGSPKAVRRNASIHHTHSSSLAASGHAHNHSHSHSHSRAESTGGAGGAPGLGLDLRPPQSFQAHARERGAPAPINVSQSWRDEAAGGNILMTPAGPIKYQLPRYTETGCSEHHHQFHSHEHHDHSHDHHDHDHDHDHDHPHAPVRTHTNAHEHGSATNKSFITRILLRYCVRWPLLYAIIVEKDSRRIFYYMLLNISFMLVQAFYGYVTNSLGLLSDTVHMFFDCVALLVGLVAAVASKWPRSQKFPYGLGKMETLSGFANGILLILLSVEIIFEAFERIWDGHKPKRLAELLIVSFLGLLVNLVGITAFGHHHHGHGHDHGHSHSHSHDEKGSSCGHSHSHSHSHDNENMHGIYLHILADTLGSASVVASTLATHFTGWSGWDPLASILISLLIFLSARPLVISSAKRLLLSVPDDVEYALRNVLAGISQQRGVVGCAVPKFWIDDAPFAEASGVHHHHHHGDEKKGDGPDVVGTGSGSLAGKRLLGIVHVVAGRGAGMEDVRDRVKGFLKQNGLDVVVQVEREGDGTCWCGFGRLNGGPAKVNGRKAF